MPSEPDTGLKFSFSDVGVQNCVATHRPKQPSRYHSLKRLKRIACIGPAIWI